MSARYTSQLKTELEKEETMLKSIKDKLVDQLQRLKVEELALVNYLSMGSNSSRLQPVNTTGTYFNTTQDGADTKETENTDNVEINSTPLVDLSQSLSSTSLFLNEQAEDEQEDDEN